MTKHTIPFKATGYFSKLICDYIDKKSELSDFYGNYPDLNGFKKQLEIKQNSFERSVRKVLAFEIEKQYNNLVINDLVSKNIKSLKKENTFTVTTGHQLNIFTGPLYFLYKITSTINLTEKLKEAFPQRHFVPVYWMATEDHDFEEINFFNFKGLKVYWNKEMGGAVGRFQTEGLNEVLEEFSKQLDSSDDAEYIKSLFEKAYLKHDNLADATRYLVNEMFGNQGLVIVDGDTAELKKLFIPAIKDELIQNTSFTHVSKTNKKLGINYNIQVNPREINLFYLKDGMRERIVFDTNSTSYKIMNSSLSFSEEKILEELTNHPQRFSPNVIMRPLYQETILPNLCYIGGGGELAYWFQLKNYFKVAHTPFPILLLRNSVLLISEKQLSKLKKLNICLGEIFLKQGSLIDKKVKEISEINIDFSNQRKFLQQQFDTLKELAKLTDKSFLGAVNAQEKKQLNGLNMLEKRLLKAQKRKLTNEIERLKDIQNELFPNQSLEERYRNFSEVYLEVGSDIFPILKNALDPLKMEFIVLEYV